MKQQEMSDYESGWSTLTCGKQMPVKDRYFCSNLKTILQASRKMSLKRFPKFLYTQLLEKDKSMSKILRVDNY